MASDDLITVDFQGDEAAQIKLAKFERNLKNEQALLRDVGIYMRKSIIENFNQGGRPYKWPFDWTTPYGQWKSEAGYYNVLIVRGALRLAVEVEERDDRVLVGVDGDFIPYAATHQNGDKSRNIQQRKYIMIQERDKDWIMRRTAKFAEQAWRSS